MSRRLQYFQKRKSNFVYWASACSAIFGGYYLTHLEPTPITGRTRFMAISEYEKRDINRVAFEEIKRTFRGHVLPEWHPIARRVLNVTAKLIRASPEYAGNWQVLVVSSPTPNAMVVPGGKIIVFTGLLNFCETDDSLAAVIGHEMAHEILSHTYERCSQLQLLRPIAFLVNLVSGLPVGGFLSNVLLALPKSRTLEAEADHVGLNLMAKACFEPRFAVDFWQKMTKNQIPELLSTHPSNASRINEILSRIPEANQIKQRECADYNQFITFFK